MIAGAVFFDTEFEFDDGDTGRKLFVVLGSHNAISVVAKTTSKQHGRGVAFGCQPGDRFHNFYLPVHQCDLNVNTWIRLDEFYELNANQLLQKKFSRVVHHVCDLSAAITTDLIQCALISDDITAAQEQIIKTAAGLP